MRLASCLTKYKYKLNTLHSVVSRGYCQCLRSRVSLFFVRANPLSVAQHHHHHHHHHRLYNPPSSTIDLLPSHLFIAIAPSVQHLIHSSSSITDMDHQNDGTRPTYSCSICNKLFSSKGSLTRHRSEAHTANINQFQCVFSLKTSTAKTRCLHMSKQEGNMMKHIENKQ